MNIYLVTYKFNHHYAVSGYNRLGEFLPCRKIAVPSLMNTLLQKLATRQRREHLQQTTGLLGYFPECRWLEFCAGLYAKLPGKSVFHFIYPENSYYFTVRHRRSKNSKIVATYHQPVRESRQFILNTEAIKKLDAVILLSESQREFFEPIVGKDKIFVVPHGIDLEFFTPPAQRPSGKRIIAVGNWLRDFPTLVGALTLLRDRAPDIQCDVVTLEANRSLFAGLPNVTFHAGITDRQLLGLYHHASMAVLSLSGAAANNALLEALACGLPIVATDLPAVREYTTPEGARYVSSASPDEFAETLLRTFSGGEATLGSMGSANRNHANRYTWEKVAEQTMQVYRAINS